jgi:hypothetical protein
MIKVCGAEIRNVDKLFIGDPLPEDNDTVEYCIWRKRGDFLFTMCGWNISPELAEDYFFGLGNLCKCGKPIAIHDDKDILWLQKVRHALG